ncbi:protein CLT1, chloroplastic-like isoform X1 [Phragmites australis]|uniref:protein CLT1, chloroplastic-like isoform X1 n=1 Tax=Phragmites australis TaxID=29695 RepID=UPI002D7673BD|nr:protein CLT1, chloroplastic-like isoform X1 [Phragmites australis]
MAPPSPITCRPSAARHPLLLRVPTARAATLGLGLGLPRTEAVVALRAHVRRIEAEPWASALVAVSRNRREEAVRCAAAGEVTGSTGVGRSAGMEVALAAAAVVAMGTGNRVLYKLALVPLRQYPFFLAQFATFGYVVVYFSILYLRYQAGIVTDEMLSLPQKPFLVVGLLEAFAAASGMAAGAVLSGASIPILSQTYLVWQLLLSAIFLKRRYRINEITGCFLVAVGVIITVASGSGTGASLKSTGILWPLLMIISFFLQAADTVLKEIIFIDAAKKLKGGSVDLFVVNSYGSAYQALFMCLLLPFLSKLWGVPFHLLPTYIKDGAACFLNMGSLSSGCEGAPLLPLLFVLVNMGFNISLLHLLKISSAVVSSLASTFSVPLSIYAFTLPLPYIGVASSLPPGFVAGAAVLTAGLLVYSLPQGQHSGNSFRNRND